jgi:hypothetical protein
LRKLAATAPRISTAKRSPTAIACVTWWVMKITATPRFLASSTMRGTCDACFTPKAAVGSSRISTRAPKWTARAMARDWRAPPDMPIG